MVQEELMLFFINIVLFLIKNVKLKRDYFGYYISYKGSNGKELRRGCFLYLDDALIFCLTRLELRK